MQVIIFRGKKIDDGQWVYGNLVVDTITGDKMAIIDVADMSEDNKNSGAYVWHDVVPESVGMYTGTKSRSGVRIYQGDINQDKGYAFWEAAGACFCWKYPNGDVFSFEDEDIWCEVIGNSYEHKELTTPNQ